MSQQRTARRLPSLLVDPAQETVRRRCRDPINVENLLVSGDPGHGGVACCGTLSLHPALCTVSLGAPGLFLQLPILEPSFAF